MVRQAGFERRQLIKAGGDGDGGAESRADPLRLRRDQRGLFEPPLRQGGGKAEPAPGDRIAGSKHRGRHDRLAARPPAAVTAANMITIGAALGSIMPSIMTHQIAMVSRASLAVHGAKAAGIAMSSMPVIALICSQV